METTFEERREQEAREREAARLDFGHKMTHVAKLLGMTFELRDQGYCPAGTLKGRDNEAIYCSEDSYGAKNRLQISSGYPRDARGQWYDERVRITVSKTKTPEQVAKDIKRRFLPDYLSSLAKVKERIAAADTYHARQTSNIAKVAKHLGVELRGENGRNSRQTVYLADNGIGIIGAYSDKEVKFEVTTTPEKAIRIIDILRGN